MHLSGPILVWTLGVLIAIALRFFYGVDSALEQSALGSHVERTVGVIRRSVNFVKGEEPPLEKPRDESVDALRDEVARLTQILDRLLTSNQAGEALGGSIGKAIGPSTDDGAPANSMV